jgi:hypothetical protein
MLCLKQYYEEEGEEYEEEGEEEYGEEKEKQQQQDIAVQEDAGGETIPAKSDVSIGADKERQLTPEQQHDTHGVSA